MSDLVCGIDVGSQGSCLSVFDAAGERLATTYQPHPLSYPRPGWAEQDPRDWRAALVNGFRDLSARVNLKRVVAISFGSQLDGLVPVDTNAQPVGPAIIWMDRRADALCGPVADAFGEERWYARSGCNLDGSHVAAKIAWVREHRPAVHDRTDRHLLPGSYMVRVACDADAVDRSNASSTMLLDPDRGDWDDALLEAWEIDRDRLPPVVGAEEVLGEVTRGLRRLHRPAAGLPGRVRLRRRDGGDAGRGRRRAGRDLRRAGHGRAGLRRRRPAAARRDPGRRVPPPRRARAVAAREPRLGQRRELPLVPRRAVRRATATTS